MKLKCVPTDFVVAEVCSREPTGGSYSLYRLSKSSVSTPEALTRIAHEWGIPRGRIQHAGLKDRHAVTSQHISVRGGPACNLAADNIDVVFLGRIDAPITPADIKCNRFTVVLRDLTSRQVSDACSIAAAASRWLIPNYFDRQRFGSVGESAEFAAAAFCRGDFESACRLALADKMNAGRSPDHHDRTLLRDHWGNFSTVISRLRNRSTQRIIRSLLGEQPDFEAAYRMLSPTIRSLHVSALQSAIWNDIVSGIVAPLQEQTPGPALLQLPAAELHFGRIPKTPAVRPDQTLPLPSAKWPKGFDGDLTESFRKAAAKRGVSTEQLRQRSSQDSFFSSKDRRVWLSTERIDTTIAPDDLHSGMEKLTVEFELPAGSFATMLIKGLLPGASADIVTRRVHPPA